jgi:hypothetical protein
VDQRRPELVRVDRPGDGLDGGHCVLLRFACPANLSATYSATRAPCGYRVRVPRIWIATMVILVACLLASMVIAIVKLA